MTTVPLDDPPEGAALDGAVGVVGPAVGGVGLDERPDGPPADWPELSLPDGEPQGADEREARSGWSTLFHPVRWFESRGHRWLPGVAFPIVVYVVWRIAHLLAIWWLQRAGGAGVVDTSLYYDGERYQRIMQYGYATYGNPSGTTEMPNSAFFPLVSWLAAPIYSVTRSVAWSSQIVANVTGLASFITVWGLSKTWRNERIGRRAVLLLALIPSSLYLWQFYSEGLFIALAAGGLWADRRGRRVIAGLCFFGLATTRSIGFLVPAALVAVRVVAPLVGALFRRGRPPARRVEWWTLAYLAAALAGLGIVMVVLWQQAGDPLAFMHVQKDWGRGLSGPWTSVINGYQLLYPTGDEIMIPALVARNFDLWCLPIIFFAIGYAFISSAPQWLVDPCVRLGRSTREWWRHHGSAWLVAIGVAAAGALLVLPLVFRTRIREEVFLFGLAPVVLILVPLVLAAASARKDRFPSEVWLIGALLIALPLCSSVLPSFNRFVMADFIIYPVYASLINRVPGKGRVAIYLALAGVAAWTVIAMLGRISVNRFVG